jgi:transposase
LIKEFLAKSNVTKLEYPPYSPDLAAADFYLFSQMKLALNGRRLCGTADIVINAKEELKRLSQNDLLEGFQHLYSRWQNDKVAQWDYFEVNVV